MSGQCFSPLASCWKEKNFHIKEKPHWWIEFWKEKKGIIIWEYIFLFISFHLVYRGFNVKTYYFCPKLSVLNLTWKFRETFLKTTNKVLNNNKPRHTVTTISYAQTSILSSCSHTFIWGPGMVLVERNRKCSTSSKSWLMTKSN